jgi:outer membrane immunogenic protein
MMSAPAGAADIAKPVYKAPVVAPPPAFTWTGVYIGGHVGGIRGRSDLGAVRDVIFPGFVTLGLPAIAPIVAVPSRFATVGGVSASNTSFMGGGQLGYNWQMGSFLFGFEGDASWTRIRATAVQNVPDPFFISTLVGTYTTEVDWTASLRGRLGVTFDRLLVYATGGAAFAGGRVNSTFTLTNPVPGIFFPATGASGTTVASSTFTDVGWTLGGGLEWAFDNNWSIAGEYRYADLGNHSVRLATTDPSGALGITPVTVTRRLRTDEATLRLNYRFGGI